MRVSFAEYARRHGVSSTTITRWKRAGYLTIKFNRIEVEPSDAALAAAGLPDMEKSETRHQAAVAPKKPPADPLPDDPDVAADFLEGLLAGQYGTQAEAERIKENALAGLRTLELQRKAGSLVEIEAATTAFFESARAIRGALTAWPAEVGPLLAADLDAPADRVTEHLATHVRKLLASLGEPDPDVLKSM